ncbi:hypothetical protein QX204_13590 [Nocardia sp. PE-7]|uniref:hypothetical protein n=1 Tax=Nocardia sp. PE-7 TaxID=3058426 RepID=UPI00265A660E|nr:hypothetical protein [Nocardia sp. PE-7]WKG12437.1 hypothetical protein QX204_13590 [Nocardia sp. PE-7]
MRNTTFMGGLVLGVVGISMVTAPTAEAAVPLNTDTGANSLTFTFVNNDNDITTCEAYAAGPVSFRTPATRVPARSHASVGFVDVPAGNYVINWACRGFEQGKRTVTVGGAALTGATPHRGVAPTSPGQGLVTGSAGSS